MPLSPICVKRRILTIFFSNPSLGILGFWEKLCRENSVSRFVCNSYCKPGCCIQLLYKYIFCKKLLASYLLIICTLVSYRYFLSIVNSIDYSIKLWFLPKWKGYIFSILYYVNLVFIVFGNIFIRIIAFFWFACLHTESIFSINYNTIRNHVPIKTTH